MLSNFEIESICHSYRLPLESCCLRSELTDFPYTPKVGYILNLDPKPPGTHWTILITDEKDAVYFDSFGEPPPTDVITFVRQRKGRFGWNGTQVQDLHSNLCGWFCVALLQYVKLHPKQSIFNTLSLFLSEFDDEDTANNDDKLRHLFRTFPDVPQCRSIDKLFRR